MPPDSGVNSRKIIEHAEACLRKERGIKDPQTRSQELAQEFKEFVDEHPELRFWQALRVWADVMQVNILQETELPMGGAGPYRSIDTFYWNEKNEL